MFSIGTKHNHLIISCLNHYSPYNHNFLRHKYASWPPLSLRAPQLSNIVSLHIFFTRGSGQEQGCALLPKFSLNSIPSAMKVQGEAICKTESSHQALAILIHYI